ncbi:MAG: formimidoylglutamate deiminase [Deltaproteobacteria bacterium]|nr:formimidoylglutamate deiminase [Deltaproteobacteria bacterium]
MKWFLPDAVWVDGKLHRDLGVLVAGETIVWVGAVDERLGEVERLYRRVLLPGFVNAHSHAFQRALRGHVQHAEGEDSFWSWRKRMYALASALNPEAVEAVSTLAFAEMVRAGFTTVGEFHYLHHQPDGTPYDDPDELARRVAHAAQRVGLRIVLLRVAYARAGYLVDPDPTQRRFIDRSPDAALAAVSRLRGHGLTAGLAPHSVRAVPRDWLQAFADFDGVVHAHVDEQPGEIEQCLAEHGLRPVHVFAEAGLLNERFTAVHLTHPDDGEIAAMRGQVCACPTTELDLGDGFLPAWKLGVPVCLGSDSHAAIDPFAEMRAVEWHSRALLGRRNVLPHEGADGLANTLLRMGTEHGARSLGVNAGRLAAGALADFVAIDLSRLEFASSRLLPAIVFNGSPAAVTDAWVGGRHVLRDGRVPGAERVANEAEAALRRAGLAG